MKKDNEKIEMITKNARACIVAIDETMMVKGTKLEIMAIACSILGKLIEKGAIDEREFDIITQLVKKETKKDTKEKSESTEDLLDKVAEEIIKKIFED